MRVGIAHALPAQIPANLIRSFLDRVVVGGVGKRLEIGVQLVQCLERLPTSDVHVEKLEADRPRRIWLQFNRTKQVVFRFHERAEPIVG